MAVENLLYKFLWFFFSSLTGQKPAVGGSSTFTSMLKEPDKHPLRSPFKGPHSGALQTLKTKRFTPCSNVNVRFSKTY